MDHDCSRDDNNFEFPITDDTCLQIVNNRGLSNRLARVLGPAHEQTQKRPICVINAGENSERKSIINFDDFGPGCTLRCGPETSAVDVLPWVNILLPAAQTISLHASAFIWKGEGVVVTGNAGSGKTGALLAAIHQGAGAVGDECIWLDRNAQMRGLFLEMEIRAAYFRELPHLRSEVSMAVQYGIFLCDLVSKGIHPFLPKLSRKFAGRARAHVQPDILRRHLAPSTSVDRLFVSEVHPGSKIQVHPANIADIIPRLIEIQSVEFTRQREQYSQYCDETGDRQNEWMENLALRFEDLLSDVLRNTKTYIVKHPPSPGAKDLFRALAATWS